MKKIECKIINNKEVAPGFYKMSMESKYLARQSKPGQFVEVKCSDAAEPLLRRPLGVHRISRSGIELLYEVVGKGTQILSCRKPGELLDVIGPLGNGFNLKPATNNYQLATILIAGGNGVAPLVALAEKLAFSVKRLADSKKSKIYVFVGAKTKSHILCEKDFKKIGCDVRITTDDGSKGKKGMVTDLMRYFLNARNFQRKFHRYPLNAKTSDFVRLLEQLNAIKGIERIRFMTSHPKDASVELFKAMRDLDKVCGHLHLPLQSGSGRILKLMNRGYTRKRYLEVVENYRSIVSGGSITTDCIVGFPSESEKDFKDTYDIMKKVGFDSSFLFKYSPRPPAKAAAFKDDVPKDVKQARLKALLDLQTGICLRKNKPLEGKVAEILVDGHNKKDPAFLSGRTRTNKVAVFKGRKTLTGKIVKVRVNSVTPYALKGRVVK